MLRTGMVVACLALCYFHHPIYIDNYSQFLQLTYKQNNGWSSDGDQFYVDGKYVTGFHKIGNFYYYFDDKTGKMVHGWKYLSDKKITVWFGQETGHMLYGEQRINGKWYYLDDNTGGRISGWKTIETAEGSKTVYYDQNGERIYGIHTIGSKKYEFDENTGALIREVTATAKTSTPTPQPEKTPAPSQKRGWSSDGTQFYVDGKYVTGFHKIGNFYYYFDDKTGKMVHGWKYLSDKKITVWFGQETGHMLYGENRINGKWYYLDDNTGGRISGWKTVNNNTYYYDSEGVKLFGLQSIDGHVYYFHDETGGKIVGFKPVDNAGHYVYTDKNGYVNTGQYLINQNWYYFSEKTGKSVQGWMYFSDEGKVVYYDNLSRRVKGEVTINGKKYTFNSETGALEGDNASVISKVQQDTAAITSSILSGTQYGIKIKNGKKYVIIAGREYIAQNADRKINVLFLGNSYTYYNNMPSIYEKLAENAGVNLDTTMIATGSTTFWGHYTNPKVKEELRSGKYDFVIIQGQSTEVQENWEGSHASAKYLIDVAKEKVNSIYLFEQMSYNGDPAGQSKIHTTYTQISEENGNIPVIHAGEAFWAYANKHPSAKMFRDDRHPSQTGSEVLAKAIWEGMRAEILNLLR